MSRPRAVAFVHYHVRGGGVTRVLEHQQRALAAVGIGSVVFVGETPPDDCALDDVRVVEGLGYAQVPPARAIHSLLEEMTAIARGDLGGAPDLWHIHNHSLGKNIALPLMVDRLARDGDRLLLQIHDFAEDYRPANYRFLRQYTAGREIVLYPQGGRVHYAFLNRRDLVAFLQAGADESRLHSLPNAVHFDGAAFETTEPADVAGRRLILYPTRAIARKNLGEFLFWAGLAEADELYGISLAPQNPKERRLYRHWVELAERLRLPVAFEMGSEHDYFGLLKCAEALATTSIAEGFGLAFLEPMLIGKPLYGRKLEEITSEFEDAGVALDSLYARLEVPVAWVGESELRLRLRKAMRAAWRAYERELTDAAVEQAYRDIVREGFADFGRLDPVLQSRIIEQLRDPRKAKETRPDRLRFKRMNGDTRARNRQVVRERFSLDGYRFRLLETYDKVMSADAFVAPPVPMSGLLRHFLAPERFCLLRS